MSDRRNVDRLVAPGLSPLALLALFAPGCSTPAVAPDGACARDPAVDVDCTGGVDGGTAAALGLVGYSCTGTSRPDESPGYSGGVPQGLICANQSATPDGGAAQAYCCTAAVTTCALDPVGSCDDPGTYAYQCRGANRPESFNPALRCGQGVYEGDLIDYCCTGTPPAATPCQQTDALACAADLIGFRCSGLSLPKGEDLGANKSRADVYYLLCPIPTPSAQAGLSNYCCFTPALPPPGASCVQDVTVPGCQPGRFGVACYGRDTPADDYPPLSCPDPGVPGVSFQGYPATLYCCDLQ
jgi:hypothetical protein